VLGNAADASNSNNTIQNNWIYRVQNSIYSQGFASSPYDQNWVITNNTLGSTTAGDKNTFRGMLLGNAKNFIVSNNTIAGVNSTSVSGSAMNGIQLAFTLDGGAITGNRISDIKQIQSTGFGANAMFFGAATTGASLLIANNI